MSATTVLLRLAVITAETPKAYLVLYVCPKKGGNLSGWLPKSQVTVREAELDELKPEYLELVNKADAMAQENHGRVVDIYVPTWLYNQNKK